MAEEQTSTREALEAAFAEAETPNAEVHTETNTEEEGANTSPDIPVVETSSKDVKAVETKTEEPEISAPNSWRNEPKELWKQLPRKLQEEIAKRETDRERYFTRESARLKNLKEVEEIFEPYVNELHARGATPAQVVRQLVAFNNLYEQDPVGTIRQMLQAKGLSLEALQEAQAQTDPKYEALTKELQELRTWRQQLEQGQATQAHDYTVSAIQSFAEQVGQDGKPVRPYFNDVLQTMLPIADALKRQNPEALPEEILNAAYERAVYIHPEVRQKLIDSEVKAREAKRIEEQKQAAQKAKASSVSVKGAPGGAVAQAQSAQSIRDALESAFADSAL